MDYSIKSSTVIFDKANVLQNIENNVKFMEISRINTKYKNDKE